MKYGILFFWLIIFPIVGISQMRDSTINSKYKPRFEYRSLVPPVSLIIAGISVNGNARESFKNEVVEERNEHLSGFHTKIDDYLQFSPVLMPYVFDIAGIKSKTDIANRTAITLKSQVVMMAMVYVLKNTTHQLRPDGSGYTSFPSGHTAQAFMGATILTEEYKDRYKWMPYAAYGAASLVGVMRMMNNRHYISDVLVGAGLGILSTKIIYWTHQYKWGRKNRKLQGY